MAVRFKRKFGPMPRQVCQGGGRIARVRARRRSENMDVAHCDVAARCGGCPQIWLPSFAQRSAKANQVKHALALQGITPPAERWLTAASEGYRNRIRLELVDGIPTFFNRDKAGHCMVLQPELRTLYGHLNEWALVHRAWLREFRVAELRAPDSDGQAALYLKRAVALPPGDGGETDHSTFTGERDAFPHWPGVKVGWEGGPAPLQRFTVWQKSYVLVPAHAFMQIHTDVNRLMVAQLVSWADQLACATFLDLYSGSGNFAVPLTASGRSGVAVEVNGAAVAALTSALGEQGLSACDAVACEAASHAAELAACGHRVDLVVADPPRAGLGGRAAPLARMARRAVVLVACRADSFAKDAAGLTSHGLELSELRLVDMFPHTSHIEVMGLFLPKHQRCRLEEPSAVVSDG